MTITQFKPTSTRAQAKAQRASNKLKKSHSLACQYTQAYGLPYHLALSVAIQQTPRTGEAYGQTGNQWLVARVTYFAKKYNSEITRLCHILPTRKAGYLQVYDIERAEERRPILENLKKIVLCKMSEMVSLTRTSEYVECLVYGYPAGISDDRYTREQESRNCDYAKHYENS